MTNASAERHRRRNLMYNNFYQVDDKYSTKGSHWVSLSTKLNCQININW